MKSINYSQIVGDDGPKVLERLRNGLNRIQNVGWVQGDMVKFQYVPFDAMHGSAEYIPVGYCAIGALRTVPEEVDLSTVHELSRNFLTQIVEDKFKRTVVQYNDNFYTKKEDIVKLYRKAIKLLGDHLRRKKAKP